MKTTKEKEKIKCENCGEEILKVCSDEWYKNNGAFCSDGCRYESETGHPGEEY